MSKQFLYQKLDNYKDKGLLKNYPNIIDKGLAPRILLRDYQKEAFQYFVNYFENDNLRSNKQLHTLFHMATGSGKTVIMAGLILYLYTKGYRNFLFFVNQTNVIEKTKDNFLNRTSNKYLFNDYIEYLGQRINIKMVDNFQNSLFGTKDINLCFTTTQKLHSDLLEYKENSLTYSDFENTKVVFISDESHHINASTKKSKEDEIENITWESTIMNAFHSNENSLFLEFTATIDLKNKNIENKYKDKIIYNYPLRNFRESAYTKEFKNISTNTNTWVRTLIAIILSEYRKYLFADLGLNIKPVLMLKSKTIIESKKFYEDFINNIKNLTSFELEKILNDTDILILKKAFKYFMNQKDSLDFLTQSIKNSFSEDKLIIINGKEDLTKEKQLLINSLEDTDNPLRAIFAVDMLNEGWDVLNLFDIVRLYDTTEKTMSYTIKEAQLIGRGARYCPFKLNEEQDSFKRKYDDDFNNEFRILETMYFHSKNDSKYIAELKSVLIENGFQDEEKKYKTIDNLKMFSDKNILKENKKVSNIKEYLKSKNFSYKINTTKGNILDLFNENENKEENILNSTFINFKDIDYHIILGASEIFTELKFNILKDKFPKLKSMKEFLNSEEYLGDIKIEFKYPEFYSLTGKDYFDALKMVFETIVKGM